MFNCNLNCRKAVSEIKVTFSEFKMTHLIIQFTYSEIQTQILKLKLTSSKINVTFSELKPEMV